MCERDTEITQRQEISLSKLQKKNSVGLNHPKVKCKTLRYFKIQSLKLLQV